VLARRVCPPIDSFASRCQNDAAGGEAASVKSATWGTFTEPPKPKYVSPPPCQNSLDGPSYDASSSSTKETLRSERRADKSSSGRGRVFRLEEAQRLPAGLGPAYLLRLFTMSERRGRRRASIEGTPSIGPIQRSFRSRNTRPRPAPMSTQNQHLLLQHRHPKHSCTWSSMIPPISLLLMSGYSHMRPSRVKILTRLVSVPKPASLAETSLATMKSRFFF